MQALTAHPAEAISGSARAPGDKSVSHRALMLGGLALGESVIEGLLEGEDVLRTAAAMRALGAEVERDPDGSWRVCGRGLGGLVEPDRMLDLGNSGTGARLLMGLIAGHPITATIAGDASLSARPMARVADPLSEIGARFVGRAGLRLPLTVIGTAEPLPIRYRLPVASAQVKSAILLAGLMAPGETTVIEPVPTRNHSEVMLRHFGAVVRVAADQDAKADGATGTEGQAITLVGQPELTGKPITVPSDPSSAAFAAVAALLLPGSELRLVGVGISPARSGLYTTLQEMGADLSFVDAREVNGEPVADLVLRAGPLQGVTVPAERAPAMIDEYPILAIAAAAAEGTTVMQGLGELRVKESDRLAAMARGLAACGVEVEEGPDSLTVRGAGGRPRGGNNDPIATNLDHRIAMSFLVLGTAAERPVTVDDGVPIETSFPDFAGFMNRLGARIEPAAEQAA